jgi:hypothetical protein
MTFNSFRPPIPAFKILYFSVDNSSLLYDGIARAHERTPVGAGTDESPLNSSPDHTKTYVTTPFSQCQVDVSRP